MAVVAVPSHFPQVVLAQDAQYKLEFSNAMVRNRWSPNQHHWWRETLWWCTIVVPPNRHHGGINQLLAEQIRAPGSRRVLASQGPGLY